jgi:hypothetical protein
LWDLAFADALYISSCGQMKFVGAIGVVLCLFFGSAAANTVHCAGHRHVVTLESRGFEHVNHRLFVNGLRVREVEDEQWFVEGISCAPAGFTITASHFQYGDSARRVFHLRVTKVGAYELR